MERSKSKSKRRCEDIEEAEIEDKIIEEIILEDQGRVVDGNKVIYPELIFNDPNTVEDHWVRIGIEEVKEEEAEEEELKDDNYII